MFNNFQMRFVLLFILLISCFWLGANNNTQENATAPSRTPEQEAALQTQKMQQELNLSQEQIQTIYDINLRHARERQVSKSRSEALQRVKNKDAEMREVLTRDQYIRLQDKRYERYPSTSTQFSRPDIQQRTQITPNRNAQVEERRSTSSYQRRTVAPADNRDRQAVPQRTTPYSEQRVIRPRQASPSERNTIEQRRIPVVPQVRTTPSPEQSRSTRTTPSSSNQSSRSERPTRR
jgi:hypothetical protein